MINQLKTKLIVPAGAKFMQRLILSMLAALMVRIAARNVLDRLESLVKASLVESAVRRQVVPTCNGCKSSRKREARDPRELVRLPTEVTQSEVFNNKGLPVFLCPVCDEQELEMALATHQKRIDNM
jgi:hypothetical protein